MKKFAGKNLFTIAALFAVMLMGSSSVHASATSNTASAPKVSGVMVITAESQIFYVEAGRFIRAYRKQLINELSNLEANIAISREAISMIEIETEQLAIVYTNGQNQITVDFAE